MTPTHASLAVLHVAEAPTETRWRRLRVDARPVAPEHALARAHAAELALLELEVDACLALLPQLRAANPELALVARVPDAAAQREAELVRAGADEVLYGDASVDALESALRAAIDRRGAALREDRLAQRHRKTERALEDVVSAASHELRSPLSVIIGFGGLLVNDLRGELGGPAVEPTRKILRAAERLESLIRDVVTFARLERELGRLEPVDAAACADVAIAELSAEARAVSAVISREPMPSCVGDAGFIQNIFAELIRNALRFHGHGPPRIVLGGARVGPRCVFFVQDDGPGFDSRHKDDVFRLFRRLAPRTAETRGDGVGLALCRRMVELMEGEIGLDLAQGQGVRAWFALPGGEHEDGPLR